MKLALVIGSLDGGGAERVMSTLANAWVRRGLEVTLITVGSTAMDKYALDAAVSRIGLGLMRPSQHWWQGLINNFRRVGALRAALRALKPDGVLSFLETTNVLSVLAARSLWIPVVVSERTSAAHRIPAVWGALRVIVYRLASALVVQTQQNVVEARRRTPRVPIHVIPNPMWENTGEQPDSLASTVLEDCGGRALLMALGRLAPEKGHDLLLQAFARVAAAHPDWCLVVLGEGPERKRLEGLVDKLALKNQVLLPGFTHTPQVLLRRAQLFALSSRYEGFPNALLEAMASGLPCVSFDCPTGPAELIDDRINGLLVPLENVEGMTAALAQLMDNPGLRDTLGRAARDKAATYSLDSVLARWNSVFDACGIIAADAPPHP